MLNKVAELTTWLINAFNGEWLKIDNPKPNPARKKSVEEIRKRSGITVDGGEPLPLSLLSGLF